MPPSMTPCTHGILSSRLVGKLELTRRPDVTARAAAGGSAHSSDAGAPTASLGPVLAAVAVACCGALGKPTAHEQGQGFCIMCVPSCGP